MEHQKVKEIISILMESSLYFDFSPEERLKLVRRLIAQVNWTEPLPGLI
ncbi:MAG: hypothetical protein HY957_03170 [Nitrospirae bacterium]|nr:hypothetical protein [Nitrospirota bacterium]